MAYEYDFGSLGKRAGEDLSSNRYRFVKIESGTGDVIQCGADDQAIGAIQNKPAEGEDADVQIEGVAKVEAGGSVTANDTVGADANGKAVTGSSTTLGVAHESVSSGEVVPVQLINT